MATGHGMPEIVFTARLTADDWDEAMHGWRCQVLNVPGAMVEAIYVDGDRVDSARYEILPQHTFIRWIAPDQPQRVAVSIKLTETLSLGKETERWKRLAIILPVAATVIAAFISGAATYFSRTTDVHAPSASTHASSDSVPNSVSSPQQAQAMTDKSDGSAIDVISKENTSFADALAIELGRTYLSRFRDTDAALFFGFSQQEGAHDLNVELTLVAADAEVRPTLSIYSKDRIKLFSRWHETKDGSSIKWTAPVTPGNYIIEVNPNAATGYFDRFLLLLTAR